MRSPAPVVSLRGRDCRAGPSHRRRADPRGPERRAAAGRVPRRRAAADHRRGGHRQDHGADAAHRLPDRHAARAARGDPRPDLHGEGGGRDGRARRPADPVRLRRDADLDLPRVRRPGAARVGARSRARPAVPRALAARTADLPAREAVRAAAAPLPAPGRPHAAPRRARDPRQPGQGRGRLAGAVPRVGGGAAGGRRGRRAARRGGGAARAGLVLRGAPAAAGRGRARGLRRPDPPPAAAAARAAGRAGAAARALPLRAGRRVPGHEPRPARAAEAAGR